MKYQDVQKGETYHDRRVYAIYPQGSDWAGPGLERPDSAQDDVAFQDYNVGERSSCSAQQFATWVTRQEAKG